MEHWITNQGPLPFPLDLTNLKIYKIISRDVAVNLVTSVLHDYRLPGVIGARLNQIIFIYLIEMFLIVNFSIE